MTIPLASSLFTETFLTALVTGGVLAGVPLMFTALGELVSEAAGVLNIGLEGMMLTGAFAGFSGAYYGGHDWVGYLAAIGGGMLVSLIMVVFCVRLLLDQIVVGIAITLLAEGATSVIHGAVFATEDPRLPAAPTVSIPGLDRIPIVGESLFTQPLVVYLGVAFLLSLTWGLRRTRPGLNLRAAGQKPQALDAAGVSVVATRSLAVLATGALAGLGGGFLAIAGAGIFVPFMTQGQGYIAIVICMLARGRPLWVLIGSLIFGTSLQLQVALQIAGVDISTDVINMIPFVAVILALILFARGDYLPPALAQPYVRGAR